MSADSSDAFCWKVLDQCLVHRPNQFQILCEYATCDEQMEQTVTANFFRSCSLIPVSPFRSVFRFRWRSNGYYRSSLPDLDFLAALYARTLSDNFSFCCQSREISLLPRHSVLVVAVIFLTFLCQNILSFGCVIPASLAKPCCSWRVSVFNVFWPFEPLSPHCFCLHESSVLLIDLVYDRLLSSQPLSRTVGFRVAANRTYLQFLSVSDQHSKLLSHFHFLP